MDAQFGVTAPGLVVCEPAIRDLTEPASDDPWIFRLAPPTELVALVLDPDSHPVAGATVGLDPASPLPSGSTEEIPLSELAMGFTDPFGHCVFDEHRGCLYYIAAWTGEIHIAAKPAASLTSSSISLSPRPPRLSRSSPLPCWCTSPTTSRREPDLRVLAPSPCPARLEFRHS